ncbi:hypothetical protein [Pseudalkalibacillus decolorationis]|uniref:hypothetical protein n=1 Tax=Pseudalkalibacillus decolorationis TaxID=163879 RepID=UPI00214896A8|nr:hypothetical protein [Pseudalkalibacillus decolorationis]
MNSKTIDDKSKMNVDSTFTLKERVRMNLQRWPTWIAYLAVAWSTLYGVLHLYWLLGGAGYPFNNTSMGLFGAAMVTYLPVKVGGMIFVILCLLGILVGVQMKISKRIIPRWFVLAYAWGITVVLILFVPDSSLIAAMAYAFLFKFHFNWMMMNQVICIFGALFWGFAALAYQRNTRNACENCGRAEYEKPFFLVRRGKWITYIAVLAPIPYAITRYAWALGIPLGVDPGFLQDFSSVNPMHHITEWVFGSICIAGGLLTLGLIRKWGEVFPLWFPLIRGKRVPILLAVIPATCVAIAVTAAGFVFTFSFIAVKLQLMPTDGILVSQIWGAVGPMLLWVPWGVALGLATISYYYRRRGQCGHCGRDEA